MTLALITGNGDLPAQLAAGQPERPLICAVGQSAPKGLTPDLSFRLETLGGLLLELGARGVTRVCFCGAVERPEFDADKLDDETRPLVPMLKEALAAGDNGALKIIMDIFAMTGFSVVGADQLAPDLLAPPGMLSEKWPDAQMRRDAARGEAVLAGLAPLDIGQSCVIAAEQVLGVEGAAGTAHLLASLPDNARKRAAILCKGPKAGQIREIDMPTIGPATIEQAHAAGLAGIVVDAGDVIILDVARCTALADEYGLVLWSRRGGEGAG